MPDTGVGPLFVSMTTSCLYWFVLVSPTVGTVLNGFDPEQNPRLGFFLAVRDAELGDHLLLRLSGWISPPVPRTPRW